MKTAKERGETPPDRPKKEFSSLSRVHLFYSIFKQWLKPFDHQTTDLKQNTNWQSKKSYTYNTKVNGVITVRAHVVYDLVEVLVDKLWLYLVTLCYQV